MILKRYGARYHSVTPNFNPAAMTEVGFVRDGAFAVATRELEDRYRAVGTRSVTADADSDVQRDAEGALLDRLEAALGAVVAELDPGDVLVIRNDRDDWPKTREEREPTIVEGENRFHFHWRVDPPLELARYAPVSDSA